NKKVKLTGSGSYFNRPWGGVNQNKGSLSSRKGTDFHVNLTETVGDNIWYRGKCNGSGSNFWIHENYTDTVEMPIIKHHNESKIKGNNDVKELSLNMDHKHNETFQFDASDSEQKVKMIVGRNHVFEPYDHEREKQEEEF